MKKYVFILAVGALLACLAKAAWLAAGGVGAGLFAWLALETHLRTRFRFLKGRGFKEAGFELGAECAQFEISSDGSCALFATLDGALAMRDARGRQLWKRPAEPGLLALLPLAGGACYVATGDEIVRHDDEGRVAARLSFSPPPFRQSYKLHLSADGSTLLLHTPWFLQFADPGLGQSGARISCEETGHYMKYAALSPDGGRVFFAGAKLLEEGQGTEARWGSWKKTAGAWAPDWAQAEEHYANSHLRGASFSQDGKALLLELHREGYEFRALNPDGSLILRKAGGEHPVLSPDAGLVLWEGALEGTALADLPSGEKLWKRKGAQAIRHKSVGASGEAFLWEGRHLMRLDKAGQILWEAWFQAEPYRFAVSGDGLSIALLRQERAAILQLPR